MAGLVGRDNKGGEQRGTRRSFQQKNIEGRRAERK
jgi:hypothetical protein